MRIPSPRGRGRGPLGAAEWEGEGSTLFSLLPSPFRRFAAPSLSHRERDL